VFEPRRCLVRIVADPGRSERKQRTGSSYVNTIKSVPQHSDSLRIGAVLSFGHRMMLRTEGSVSTIGSVSVLRTKSERQVERVYLCHLKRLTHTGLSGDSKHLF
jgi:hypothetical protein